MKKYCDLIFESIYNIPFSEYFEKVSKYYDNHHNPDFSKYLGKIIEVDINFIYPRRIFQKDNKTEWDVVDPNHQISNKLIEVNINKDGEMVLHDGHHRLKKYLSMGKKYIKVYVLPQKINSYGIL